MRVEGIHIAGIGTADTDLVSTAEAVERGWWDADEQQRSGLLSISVAGTTPAPELAIAAANSALAHSRHAPGEFSGVFHTNVHPQGPDGWSAPHYINRHTVNQPVTSLEVRNGCVGFFSALNLAVCYLGAERDRTAALVTAADNFGTPAVDRWRASKQYVLADGGGAVVLSKRGGFARVLTVTAVSDPELELKHRSGETMFPPGLTAGRALDFRSRMACFQQRSAAGLIPPLGDFGAILFDAAQAALKDAGLTLDQITRVVHDGFTEDGIRDMLLDPVGVGMERGIWEFTRRAGHAGPLDMIRGLEHVWRSGAATVGDRVLMVGCAPGMEAACVLLEITQAP
ncbi:ketoacyl-ACP synthase III family protein [Streptomyces sp. MZ04]|uniref:ketoacyl-ACP synthase III family protein n=1 Tax=Streptomyces sp. MZ04 TaxID=2559236 RepID=UPI00107ECD0F|nr:ketoacyl-ACP synthase III family protein [Streptomyces sp. MZ04]TGB15134.1 3-oxoacyl-ACP synthase [Streptomyces sp. MZ04]